MTLPLQTKRMLALNGVNLEPPPDPGDPLANRLFAVRASVPMLFGMTVISYDWAPPYQVILREPYSGRIMLVDLRKKPQTDDMRQMLDDLAGRP